ncbi:ribokinase [Oscillospiraceae bacterium PP1C4]
MKKICVIGSINMDVVIKMDRIPREGENIFCERVDHSCGGKGENQAIALSKLGADTLFYGCVGNDAFGDTLLQNMRELGVDTTHVLRKNVSTGVAYILLESNGDNRIIVNPGANEAITAEDIRRDVTPLIEQSDMVLIQLEVSLEAISEIVAICNRLNKKLIVDAGPVRGCKIDRLMGAYCISPNETELSALIGEPLETEEDIRRGAQKLVTLGIQHVVVKLGAKGCLYVTTGGVRCFDAYRVKAIDTTGAGDSFMAGFCAGLMEGMSVEDAISYATKCGAVAVMRMGAVNSMPSREDIAIFEAGL